MATQKQMARKQRAYDRFGRGFKHDKALTDNGYKVRKAIEQVALERALGIPSSEIVKHTALGAA